MKIKNKIKNNIILLIGSGFTVLFWILDSAIHSTFEKKNLIEEIFRSDLHEVLIRLFVIFLIISFSAIVQRMTNKSKDAKEVIERISRQNQLILDKTGQGIFGIGVTHHGDDEVFWRKDGTYFPIRFMSNPIRERGELKGAVVTFERDIRVWCERLGKVLLSVQEEGASKKKIQIQF